MENKSAAKSALVTGATGYVGGHLARRLVKEGWHVWALVRADSNINALSAVVASERIMRHDGTALGLLHILETARPTFVFHLAAKASYQHHVEELDELVNANVRLGIQLAEAMTRTGTSFLINTGTFWQHYRGPQYDPVSLYAATKQSLEDALLYYSASTNLRVLTLKLTDTYGPGDPRGRLFSLLMEWKAGDPPLALSPGEQLLDLVYIEDVVSAYVRAAELVVGDEPSMASYFVRSGRLLSLRDIVKIFEEISGKNLNIDWGGRPYRPREVMKPWGGTILPAWAPQTRLEDGIRNILEARQRG